MCLHMGVKSKPTSIFDIHRDLDSCPLETQQRSGTQQFLTREKNRAVPQQFSRSESLGRKPDRIQTSQEQGIFCNVNKQLAIRQPRLREKRKQYKLVTEPNQSLCGASWFQHELVFDQSRSAKLLPCHRSPNTARKLSAFRSTFWTSCILGRFWCVYFNNIKSDDKGRFVARFSVAHPGGCQRYLLM